MNQPYCLAPFYHQHISSDGSSRPCCAWWFDTAFKGDPLDYWTSDFLLELQAAMLAGTPPEGCRVCTRDTALGVKVGQRHVRNEEAAMIGYDISQGPVLLGQEIDISNVCNLRCRMCSSSRSTKWQADELAMGISPVKLLHSGWRLDSSLASTIKALTFLGGEPMLHQDEIADALELIDDHGRLGEIRVTMTTNCTKLLTDRLYGLLQRCNTVHLSVSIDALGIANDYIRSDSHWADIETNLRDIDRICGDIPHWSYMVTSAVSVLNVNILPELWDWLFANLRNSPPKSAATISWWPHHLSAFNVNESAKTVITERYAKVLERMPLQEQIVDTICRYIATPPKKAEADFKQEFWQITNQLDNLRGTDFRIVNPEMAAWLDN